MRNFVPVLRLVRQHVERFDDLERYERRLAELNSVVAKLWACKVSVALADATFSGSGKATKATTTPKAKIVFIAGPSAVLPHYSSSVRVVAGGCKQVA